MIERFDLTRLIYIDCKMSTEAFEESKRLGWLIGDNPNNLDYHLERARFFIDYHEDIHIIISYCYIIKNFDNNLTAYIELAQYFWEVSNYE